MASSVTYPLAPAQGAVEVPVSPHVPLPKVGEPLWDLLRGDLLQPEDTKPGHNDAEDVHQGQGQAETKLQVTLQTILMRCSGKSFRLVVQITKRFCSFSKCTQIFACFLTWLRLGQ